MFIFSNLVEVTVLDVKERSVGCLPRVAVRGTAADLLTCLCSESTSPSLDSEATMEVDTCDVSSDGGHSMDEQDEPCAADDKLFFMEGSGADGDKDDETLRAIR